MCRRRPPRGNILVLTAFLMTFIFALLAFSIDAGYMYVVRGELQSGRRVASEFAFLREILPAIPKLGSTSLRRSLSALIEKYLLLMDSTGRVDPSLREPLQATLRSSRDLALLAAKIEEKLETFEAGRLAERFYALSSRIASEPDAALREPLTREVDLISTQLRVAWKLEEHHAAAAGRLVSAQAAMNRILGNQLVLEGSLDELDVASLERETARLAQGVDLSREIEKELREIG